MCKKYCLNYTLVSDKVPVCKTRDHKKKQMASSGDDDTLMEEKINVSWAMILMFGGDGN